MNAWRRVVELVAVRRQLKPKLVEPLDGHRCWLTPEHELCLQCGAPASADPPAAGVAARSLPCQRGRVAATPQQTIFPLPRMGGRLGAAGGERRARAAPESPPPSPSRPTTPYPDSLTPDHNHAICCVSGAVEPPGEGAHEDYWYPLVVPGWDLDDRASTISPVCTDGSGDHPHRWWSRASSNSSPSAPRSGAGCQPGRGYLVPRSSSGYWREQRFDPQHRPRPLPMPPWISSMRSGMWVYQLLGGQCRAAGPPLRRRGGRVAPQELLADAAALRVGRGLAGIRRQLRQRRWRWFPSAEYRACPGMRSQQAAFDDAKPISKRSSGCFAYFKVLSPAMP
jgi:hypothetical protein